MSLKKGKGGFKGASLSQPLGAGFLLIYFSVFQDSLN